MINVAPKHGFSIENLPLGIFNTPNQPELRAGMALGDFVIDLAALAHRTDLGLDRSAFLITHLNPLIQKGKTVVKKIRKQVRELYLHENKILESCMIPMSEATMHMPVEVRNYTDFYSSEQHAYNVGCMFRDPENALPPNWKYIPIGYHGRASSIVVSGTDFHRPKGQVNSSNDTAPTFKASERLDFEVEMATVIGKENRLGEAIPIAEAADYIAGFLIFNDWSARDIQRWEYAPLGPFLGKNFASSVSVWLVDIEILEDFYLPATPQAPAPLDYLKEPNGRVLDIHIEVYLETKEKVQTLISKTNFKHMYWTVNQQIAHHTVNGCNLCVGDILASGTISGREKSSFGSMLELSWGGKEKIPLKDGSERTFLEDFDTIIMKAYAENSEKRISFGEVRGTVLPAR